jgi:ParB family chromosome partitioning protein
MMRKTLGRGLDALIGEVGIESETDSNVSRAHGSAPVTTALVGQITPGKYQPRIHFDEERLEELRRAIETQGIIEPLIVRPIPGDGQPRYELIAGERRLRAARAAGLTSVPIIVRELDDRAALEMALVENIVRENLSPIEEAIAFKRLAKIFSLSQEDIATRVGKSRPYVSNAVRLLELPQEVIELIAGNQLSAGQARPLLAIGSPEGQIAAARSILAGRVSARGAEEIAGVHRVLRRSESGSNGESESVDPNLSALAEAMQRALKRKVRIVRRRGKSPGRIEIDYYDDGDLTAVAEMVIGNSRAGASA